MANALQQDMPSDAPNADAMPQQAPQGGNALGGAPAPEGPPQPPQQPAPSLHQVQAGLHHFHAIAEQLSGLMKDPDFGRTDIKSKIIDSTTKLVGEKIFTPASAVAVLGDVPDRPFDQKKWVMQHFQQAQGAANQLLDHFRAANPGDGQWQADIAATPMPSRANHQTAMSGLHEHYKGLSRGR